MLIELRIDDLAGKEAMVPADETIRFGLDNNRYRIDLSKVHADEMREVFVPYVKAASRKEPLPPEEGGPRRHRRAGKKRDGWLVD